MTAREFVRRNRAEIDRAINAELFRYDGRGGPGTIPDPPPRRNDAERLEWCRNSEGLYLWARSEGARL